MRVQWRRLRAGEADHELIWLVVTIASGAVAAAWLALRLPWPICNFRALTGWPCVTCGATRALTSFLRGDLAAAWQSNPLVFAGLCGVVLFDLYAIAVLVSQGPRLRFTIRGARPYALGLILLIAGSNWLYLLLHR